MIKKIAIGAVSAALVLSAVAPAFADADITINNENASVYNAGDVSSNTGNNQVTAWSNGELEGISITTGDATSSLKLKFDVNNSKVDLCGCEEKTPSLEISNGNAQVYNEGDVHSSTGDNSITASDGVEDSNITTGASKSILDFTALVNTTVVGGLSE